MASASPAPLAPHQTTTSLSSPASGRPWLAIATGVLVLLVLSFQQIAQPDLAAVYRDPIVRLSTLGAALLGLALLVARRFQLMTTTARTVMALTFEVAVAFWISMVETATPIAL